ncbi:MAG: DEAD/DEAH box helicase [Bacteroidales bacterium]|nr:DEAD/DEAH box helicase [Bacteroidales bacterium]
MQLKAGYFTNGIETLKTSDTMAVKVDSLLESLSYFDVDTDIAFLETCDDAAVALIHNIVSRGTPTYASQFVEDILSTTIGKTLKRIADNGTIYRDIQKQEVKDMVFKALHIIDPRVKVTMERDDADHKAQMVYDFIKSGAVPSQGDYIWQIADTERKYSDIFKFSKHLRRHLDILTQDYPFIKESCDLCFTAPYSENTADCVTFAFDPNSTATFDNTDYITEERNTELLKSIDVAGRVIVRKSDNPYERTEELANFVQSKYFDIVRDNYNSPLYKTEDGIEALQIALTPLAIARIQKVVLEAINSGALSLEARTWHIGVIERDVPCAFLAFEDLKQHFNKLFVLENNGRKFPFVKLEIFHTEEFANTELNLLYQGSRDDISEFNPLTAFDLLIDISILRRSSALDTAPRTIAAKYAVIRSSHAPAADTHLMYNAYMHYDINIEHKAKDANYDADDEDLDDDDDMPAYSEQEDAMLYFLKNIFAKNAFLDGQAATIAQLLNGNNVLHVSAPGTGKSLIMLYAAMMKPAYSFILPPTIAVMKTQFQDLRRRKIDIDYYINPVLQNSYDRSMAVKEVTKGSSLITLISPSLIHDPYIRSVFHAIDSLNIPLAYIMIDEAQRLSLQTTEYRAYYQDISNIIAKNFSDENTTALRIGAFSSTMETNIQNEIAEKLRTDVSMIQKPDLSKIDITVREIDMASVGNENETYLSQKLKQVEAARLIANDADKARPTRTIVLSWTPPFDPTVPDGEPNKVAGLDTKFYSGDIEEDGTTITNGEAAAGMRAIVDFCEGNGMVLSGTYSAGVGISAPNVGRIILMEPPMSLDSFCRLSGRADSSKSPKIDILLNTAPKDFLGEETVRDDMGNLSTAQNIIATNFDTAASLTRLMDLAPGAAKEKTVMHEILDGVMWPERTDRQNIIEAVYNEFNVVIETDTEPMVRPYQLYIYAQNRAKSYGYIDFRSRTLNMPEMQYDRPMAEKLQSYIFDIINDNTDDPLAFLATMGSESLAEENDGIQTALDAIMEGKTTKVIIPMYNNSFADAANLLNQNLGTRVTALELLHCYSKTDNYNDFEKLVASDTAARPRTLEDRRKLDFKNIYAKMRNGKDTLLAVSRLKEIDIINDYLVNRATGTVTVSLTKHNKDFYRMKLLPVLQRNLTKERMLAYMTGIEEEKYLVMEKYTDVLIDFFYSEIYPLYERSAMESSKFFKTVLERQKNDTITKQSVVSNLQNYFTSRYKCSFVFGENIAAANNGDVDKIFGLIENAGSNINSLMNLQETISLDTPENRTATNKIIYGYCRLFTDKQPTAQSRYDAYANISDGLTEYRRQHTVKEFDEQLETITDKIASENLDLKDEAEEVLPLQIHHQWLRWFNSEVLKVPMQ